MSKILLKKNTYLHNLFKLTKIWPPIINGVPNQAYNPNMGLLLQSDLSTELDQFALVKILIKIAGAATWKFTKGQLQKIKYLFSYYRHPLISGVLISAIFNLFSSSLVLESNLDIHGFLFPFFFVSPH